MKKPPYSYTKSMFKERRPVRTAVLTAMLRCVHIYKVRDACYQLFKNPKSDEYAELMTHLINLIYQDDISQEELFPSADIAVNRIIDFTNALTQLKESMLEGLCIEKEYVDYFTEKAKVCDELYKSIGQIGGEACSIYELIWQYELGKFTKQECEEKIQSFVNHNPRGEITGAKLRRMYVQLEALFWETFEQFYDTDVNAPFIEDEASE
ncbi:hypothetical protein [Capnocytophaga felis]|uniref:Uncharacterized protein n=1 Tax=Capnocytophaga felis TaxID=2267611 RepID=A0A5M4B7C5_9FLAO|nr:hypothetical protein [Capnocytophaga felis]GET45499.1 hypothetical protein RCZ01_08010 [Capnocytophaga felis]GET47338.1 hypothetical protein RCZ02_01690 [Capnocytophaga felis]